MKKNTDIFSLWDTKILSYKEFQALGNSTNSLSEEQLRYFSLFGILAPTSHNSIPQRFRLGNKEDSLSLLLDREFILPQSDPVGRQALVSLGCVVKNIELVAEAYGWKVKSDVHNVLESQLRHSKIAQREKKYVLVVDLIFSQIKKVQRGSIIQAMLRRKVLRSEYDATVSLPMTLSKKMQDISKKYPQLDLHLISNRLVMRGFGKFQEQADRFVMENQRFAQELGDWLIENDNTTLPYAMRGREFGFDDVFAKHIHLGLLGKKKLLPDQIAFFAKGGKTGIDSSSAVAVITVKKDSTQQRIDAGKLYEEIALLLTEHNLFTAVHAGITEVDWVNTMFATTVLHTSSRPTVVFRIGQPKRSIDQKRLHSARPKVEELWI